MTGVVSPEGLVGGILESSVDSGIRLPDLVVLRNPPGDLVRVSGSIGAPPNPPRSAVGGSNYPRGGG